MVGVGGGFLLVPLLLYLHPEQHSVWVVSVSLLVVALNATSGTLVFLFRRRVHLRVALVFLAASLPGSVLGVWLGPLLPRTIFEVVFGVALICYALVLLVKKEKPSVSQKEMIMDQSHFSARFYLKGTGISLVVGFVAALLGIGGGVVYVPVLFYLFGFPILLATGTSQFILAGASWFSSLTHYQQGHLDLSAPLLWWLAGGAIVGAQLGARLANRISSQTVLRILSVVMGVVGIRLLIRS